jgi:uncharacterized protein
VRIVNESRGSVLSDRVEVADGLIAKFFGLMGRESLAADEGLWLPESNGIHMMFMRFPIDALFLGRATDGGVRPVVRSHPGLRPWTGIVLYVRGAHGVVELPVGTIAASGTQVGDIVRFESE